MNKQKSPGPKVPLIHIIIFVSLALGIGCICWALINIGAQSAYSVDNTIGPSSIPTIPMQQSQGEDTVSTQSVLPSTAPSTEKNLYPVYPSEGETIGRLTIPALNLKLPIIEGTEKDDLKKGVGHYAQSVLPGVTDNCVLSGHRDTVFANLGKLKLGDYLIVTTMAGTFTYEVNGIRIVDEDDRTVIVPTDHAVLTVTTCYPFVYVGSAPDRYIVSADLVINNTIN